MDRNLRDRCVLLVTVATTILGGAAMRPAHAAAIFEGLGSAGGAGVKVASVSGNGETVVGELDTGSAYWTATTGWVGLSGGLYISHLGTEVLSVSADGKHAVGYCNWESQDSFGPSAYTWDITPGNVVSCGLLSSSAIPNEYLFSTAVDVSSDGSIIVGWSDVDYFSPIWEGCNRIYTTSYRLDLSQTPATRTYLGVPGDTPAGDCPPDYFPNSFPTAVSADGTVVIGWDSLLGAYTWYGSEAVSLGQAPDGQAPSALEVSSDGSVIVGTAGGRAYRWETDAGWSLLDLLPGTTTVTVNGMSADGAQILGHADGAVITLWRNEVPVDLLAELTTVHGLDLSAWSQLTATAISEDGTVIIGNGVNAAGLREGWRVRIAPGVDADNDAFSPPVDCNDNDAEIYPGAVEIPYDGVDQDCSGADLTDVDMDGFDAALDCNDNDASINPGATEIPYDAIDQDCSGGDLADVDLDGFDFPLDCNDNDASIYPGAPETKHDGIDQDCNGYDLTIDIVKAEVKGKRSYTLSVTATSALGADAALVLEGYGPLEYNARKNRWTATLRKLATPPATVTVTGVEGSETLATTGL